MEQITAVIVEDIIVEAELIEKQIIKHFPDIKIVGIAHNFEKAVKLILNTKPTFLILDIKLGGDIESFDVLNELYLSNYSRFIPIFVTAYGSEAYAVRAMDYAGASYINKPIDEEKLRIAIEKSYKQLLLNTFNFDLSGEKVRQFLEQISRGLAPEYIFISLVGGGEQKIKISEITYLEADENVTYFHFTKREKLASNKTLKTWDDKLTEDYEFCRIHSKYLVNLRQIEHHRKNIVTLSNGEKIEASRRMYDDLKDELAKLNPIKHNWMHRAINFMTKYFK